MILRVPLTAVVGAFLILDQLRPRDPVLVLEEVQALRQEVARTRELVLELEASSGSCLWQLWGQGWLLRLSGLADLVLIILLLRGWFQRRREISEPTLALGTLPSETQPSSVASVLSTDSGVQEEGSASSTASPSKLGRPTRPSDLKRWQTSR